MNLRNIYRSDRYGQCPLYLVKRDVATRLANVVINCERARVVGVREAELRQ